MVLAMLGLALSLSTISEDWILIPGKPYTYEDPLAVEVVTVYDFHNPTSDPIPVTLGNHDYSLPCRVIGAENVDGIEPPDWAPAYATLFDGALEWTDLAHSFTIPAGHCHKEWWTADKSVGAQGFHWWENEDARLSRSRVIHSNLQGRHVIGGPFTPPTPGSEA